MTALTMQDQIADPGPSVALRGGSWTREVRWGQSWQMGTPAYWIAVARDARNGGRELNHRLGENLMEEIAVCILGGFGLPFELGLAAFCSVRNELLHATTTPSAESIEAVLSEPLQVGGGARRYRFPHQRAQRLAAALAFVDGADLDDMSAVELRDWLIGAPGIGPKTASWIVRNQRATDEVAVLDVHVMRAGVRAGVFPEDATVQRNYLALEELFLGWAAEGNVSAADLDAVIWAEEAYWARHRDARP